MKYEIYEVTLPKSEMSIEVGVVHDENLVHAIVSEHMVRAVAENFNSPVENVKVVSAGFCNYMEPFECRGESDSLKLCSRGEADSRVLSTSMLQHKTKHVGDYEEVAAPLQNMAHWNGHHLKALRSKRYTLANDVTVGILGTCETETIESPARLRYLGPSIDSENRPVQLFTQDKLYATTHTPVLVFDTVSMCSVFESSKPVNALVYARAVVINIDDVPMTCTFLTLQDPYPLSDDHDMVEATVVSMRNKTRHKIVGSLRQIAENLNIELDDE